MPYFIAFSAASGNQLYKLLPNESVLKWTDPGISLNPHDLTLFNNAVWFGGDTAANGNQLYKLGIDGSVTKWTSMGATLVPQDFSFFNTALWCESSKTRPAQLYKMGFDGSVPKWTAAPGGGRGLQPLGMTVFNDALWFNGPTPANGFQLYK